MNSDNLIRLGAMLQTRYKMSSNFKIMRIPSDFANPVYVVADAPTQMVAAAPSPVFNETTDAVVMEKFASSDNLESIRAGYSAKVNTLVLQER